MSRSFPKLGKTLLSQATFWYQKQGGERSRPPPVIENRSDFTLA
jgi:hypothetical protein